MQMISIFVIQIEYTGYLEEVKIKKYKSNFQYKFIIIGKTKNPRRYSKIGGGEFILCFSVGLDFIIRNYDYIVENNDLNGILNIIYYIESSNYDDDEAFLGDDDNWEY